MKAKIEWPTFPRWSRWTPWIGILVLCISVSWALASRRNLTPDAVTQATTWNDYEGDLGALFDGKTPDNSDSPPSFLWVSKGILWITFPEPVEFVELRLYVGSEAGEYIVKAYLGGKLDLDMAGRSPEGELKARVESREYVKHGWATLTLPPGTVIDNVELVTFGTAEFYEMELLGPQETPVRATSWGFIKNLKRDR